MMAIAAQSLHMNRINAKIIGEHSRNTYRQKRSKQENNVLGAYDTSRLLMDLRNLR